MRNIQGWQWFIIIVAIIVLVGWKRLPDAARSVGRSMRIFKSEVEQMGDKDDDPDRRDDTLRRDDTRGRDDSRGRDDTHARYEAGDVQTPRTERPGPGRLDSPPDRVDDQTHHSSSPDPDHR